MAKDAVEPWLRGTLTEYDALRRQVLHALELAGEDVERWCAALNSDELEAKPFGIAPVGFHLRHMARSLDRLLTYAEGRQLTERQRVLLASELEASAEALAEFRAGLAEACARVIALAPDSFEQRREVGRDKLPSTLGGLLVHVAEHTQRHVGQAVTTARVVTALRGEALLKSQTAAPVSTPEG
jgi:uncharacterized damage-inducible protein DinB